MTLLQYMTSQFTAAQYLDFITRIVAACVAGFVIGYNPKVNIKGIGTRTHIIACCAAALIMIISKYGFVDTTTASGSFLSGTKGTDPARLAAQAVSGISFLCAGIIFKSEGGTVRGLTTAAGMWLTVAVGLGIGAGMYYVSLFTVAFVFIMRVIYRVLPIGMDNYSGQHLRFSVTDGAAFSAVLEEQLKTWKVHKISNRKESREQDNSAVFEMNVFREKKLTFEDLESFAKSNNLIRSFSVESLS